MRIPNRATDGLLLAFAVAGLLVLPFPDYAWRLALGAGRRRAGALGLGVHALGLAGGGDVKFAVAAAPFVALRDLDAVLLIYGGCLLVTWVLPGRRGPRRGRASCPAGPAGHRASGFRWACPSG